MTEIAMNDLLSQKTKRNPHAFFAPLRTAESIYYIEGLNSWVLTTHEDAMWLFKDPRFTKDNRKITPLEGEEHAIQEAMESATMRNMLMTDPPDHTRLRSLVSKAFTPRMIELLRPRVQQIADELLDAVQDRGTMDIITEFAFPLPITVILEMLGIPSADRQKFRGWTQAIISMQDGALTNALQEFFQYIRTLLDEKRAHPDDRLVSKLVQVEEQGDQLSEQELVSMIFLLIVAGHETTGNLLGNGMLALLQHPDQLQMLRHDPSLVPVAVEEILRYTAPVSISDERFATEDIPLHGKVIRKGQMVVASLLSANADPQHCPAGDTLDITRQENQHLSFGKGIHFCLGAPLARMEGQIAFSTLLRRLPNLQLAGDPEQLVWNVNPMLRGLTSLPVTF
jgi:cytochrome P450